MTSIQAKPGQAPKSRSRSSGFARSSGFGKASTHPCYASRPEAEEQAMSETAISIDEAVEACRLAGNGMVPGKAPVMSPLKREASLVGLAYLNYIYQNDIANRHFCEAMLLMARRRPRPRRTLMSRCSGKRAPRDHGGAGRRAARLRLRHRPQRPARGQDRSLARHAAENSRLMAGLKPYTSPTSASVSCAASLLPTPEVEG
jgi:hypothetical protein